MRRLEYFLELLTKINEQFTKLFDNVKKLKEL